MLDLKITGGTLVDGTGAPSRQGDIGIKDGRIVAVGKVDESATRTIDATDLMVAPGLVDPHTHYDAQLYWDPLATPSSWHGVTSIIGGNCGFSLAPLKDRDADFTRRMMAQVEGMPLVALENGVKWGWGSFGQYLDGLEGNIAVNAGFLVGHCALRRYVMGAESSEREATEAEVAEMEKVLRESISAGGMGLSTSRSSTHVDGDGTPVPSRFASEEELLTLCKIVGEYPGTQLEAILQGCLGRFAPEEVELMARMTSSAKRPLNWNVLSIDAASADRTEHQLLPSKRARELGGRVLALSMPVFSDNNMSFLTFCAIWLMPGWRDVLDCPVPERIRRLKDPAVRADLMAKAKGSNLEGVSHFERYLIGETYSDINKQKYEGRMVSDIAAEMGVDPFTAIVEVVANDDLKTVLWPQPSANTPEDWNARATLWANEDIMLGGSDAGAHLDRILGSPYPSKFLADTLRGRKLVSIERAVQLLSDVPSRWFGLRGRGRLAEGYHADVIVFDPTTVDSQPPKVMFDLPGESKRLLAGSFGMQHVFVNGVETVREGDATGATAGVVLRSHDLDTVDTSKL
ncbi:MAG: amidohydrolase family protein [Acidimicrobiia bacterium]